MNVNRNKLGQALRTSGIVMTASGVGMLNPYVVAFGAIMTAVGVAATRSKRQRDQKFVEQLGGIRGELVEILKKSNVPPEHRDVERWAKIIQDYYDRKPPTGPGKRP